MTEGRLKKKVFVTPEKPGVAEKTCWNEDEKPKKLKPKVKAKEGKDYT